MRYSYFILIFCISSCLLHFGCDSSGARIINTKMLHKINAPSEKDFYHFVTHEQEYLAKVERFTEDSIYFLYVKSDPGFQKHSGSNYGNLLLKREEMQISSLSKSDLISAPENRNRKSIIATNVILPTLNNNEPLMLHEIRRVKDLKEVPIAVKDPVIEEEVRTVFNQFQAAQSLDESVSFLDSTSISYLSTVLEKAKTEDVNELKQFILASEYSEADYQVALFTKYLFLTDKNKGLSSKKLLKEFLPFYALFCPSMLSKSYIEKDLKLRTVRRTGHTSATANLVATANVISQGNLSKPIMQIDFNVLYNFENDQWKMNLPSGYNYLQHQIAQVTLQANRNKGLGIGTKYEPGSGEKEFRQMVRKNIMDTNPSIQIDEQLIY